MTRESTPPACEHARELLARRVDTELGVPDADLLERHLAGCEACREVASWIGEVEGLSARATVPAATEAELARIEDAVLGEIRGAAKATAPRRRRGIPRWFVPSAAAAAVVAFFSWWQLDGGSDPLQLPASEPATEELIGRSGDPLVENEGGREEKLAAQEADPSRGEVAQQPPVLAKSVAPSPSTPERADISDAGPLAPDEERIADLSSPPVVDGDAFRARLVADEIAEAVAAGGHRSPAAEAKLLESPDLRVAARAALQSPSPETVTQLLDAWPLLEEQLPSPAPMNVSRSTSTGASEKRAQRLMAREELAAEPLQPALGDSLRWLLEELSADDDYAPLRERILRLLEEISDLRE